MAPIDPNVLRLVQVTLRTFYDAKYVIVADQLLRKEAMRDEELAARIGLNTKDLGKLTHRLAEDGFLATHRRLELRPGAMKATSRTWYYIDYQRTIDNIKWRMFKIRKVIDDKLRNELDQQGYVCPRCKKRFSTLDAGALLDFISNTMRCDVCSSDLIDNENLEDVKRSKDKMYRLQDQTKPIVEALKKTEQLPLMAFDIADWLEKAHPVQTSDLPRAQSSGPAKVTIELVDGASDAAERQKKESEAEARRTQNALPSWIERSTITGELTAVGAAHHKPGTTSAGPSIVDADGNAPPSPTKAKPEQDDTDAYYANLAAAQAATASGSGTRGDESQQGSPASGTAKLADSGYEEFGDDLYSHSASPASVAAAGMSPSVSSTSRQRQGSKAPIRSSEMLRPPSVASLSQSLGKRSREPSEEDDGPDENGKKSRTGDTTPVEHVTPTPPDAAPDEGEDDEAEPSDEAMVSVGGKEMPFSEVTEDMTEQMTADEYTRYFEVMSTVG